jgi:hypothetical protein
MASPCQAVVRMNSVQRLRYTAQDARAGSSPARTTDWRVYTAQRMSGRSSGSVSKTVKISPGLEPGQVRQRGS